VNERWKVSEVARIARVSVRTLHHYDAVGLLPPSGRTDAGYRLYARRDLERLQQILVFRELGFALEAIGRLLDETPMQRADALRAQRALLVEKRDRTDAVIRSVERTLASMDDGSDMEVGEMFEGFEDLTEAPADLRRHHREHAAEAHERWGDTDAFTESMRRAKSLRREDWATLERLGEEAEARMAELLAAGADPEGQAAMDGAEAMRAHIDRWFYPCSHGMHAGLADMYEADPRFRAHYEDRAPGLAAFVAKAIRANARRAAEADLGGSTG
jgi:DNA-binding transcriptional MerR regulator